MPQTPAASPPVTLPDVPGPLELKCLQAIWQLGEANVKDVRDVLTRDRKLAYTTVMTTLERLEKKGALRRRKSGKAFLYQAAKSESQLRHLAVQHLLDEYFHGSREALREYLAGTTGEAGQDREPVEHRSTAPSLDTTLL